MTKAEAKQLKAGQQIWTKSMKSILTQQETEDVIRNAEREKLKKIISGLMAVANQTWEQRLQNYGINPKDTGWYLEAVKVLKE